MSIGIVGVVLGMILQCQSSISSLDFGLAGVLAHFQHIVVSPFLFGDDAF